MSLELEHSSSYDEENEREKPAEPPKPDQWWFSPLLALLTFLVLLTVFLIMILSVLLISRSSPVREPEKLIARPEIPKMETSKNRNVCGTPECITLAHQLSRWRDPAIDPCMDFYKSACGKYTEHDLLPNRNRKKTMIMMNLIREFLNSNVTSGSKPGNDLRLLYRKCKSLEDPDVFNMERAKMILEVIENIGKIGPWPILDGNWDASKFNLNAWLSNMAKLGIHDFGLFRIDQSVKHFSIGASRSKAKNRKTIMQILKANSFRNIDQNILDADIEDVDRLMKKIHMLGGNMFYDRAPYEEMKKRVPSVDFDAILKIAIGNPKLDWHKFSTKIVSMDVELFYGSKQNLETIIRTTPPRVLANLLIFEYIASIDKFINDPPPEKSMFCEKWASDRLPLARLLVFVRKYFDRENLDLVDKMVDELKKSYKEMLEASTWLSEQTKQRALLKLEKMTRTIGFPDEKQWEQSVEAYHEKLDINLMDTFLTTNAKIRKFWMYIAADHVVGEKMFDPIDDHLQVNAYYDSSVNHLGLWLGFIDEPNFDATFPMYAKLAVTGEVVGHEIGHAYDRKNIDRDENGQLANWLRKEEMDEYMRRTECLVDQYNNYDDPDFGRNLNGTLTIGEMTADHLGAISNWKTLKRFDMSKEPDVIGFEDHDPYKMYFYIATLGRCSSPDKTPLSMMTDVHPTTSFRVNGVFSNMKAFAETFNCPVGSPMNPVKKCEIF